MRVLLDGTSRAAVDLPGLGRELLEGVEVEASPGFDAWLLGGRRRLHAVAGGVLREGALRAIAGGNVRDAVDLATRLVGTDPLDEDAHVLLVRAFAATGDEVAVERQLNASADLFRRELGTEIGPELYQAARIDTAGPSPSRPSRASMQALVESGNAAVLAGAVDAGLDDLRSAAVLTRDADATDLEADRILRARFGARARRERAGRGGIGRAAPGDRAL